MSNEEIKNMFNEIHNVFWKKWRDNVLARDSVDWEVIVKEGKDLIKKYNHCPLVVCNVRELIGELSNRMERSEKNAS